MIGNAIGTGIGLRKHVTPPEQESQERTLINPDKPAAVDPDLDSLGSLPGRIWRWVKSRFQRTA